MPSPYLRDSSCRSVAPGPHLGQALGVVLPRLDHLAELRGDVGGVGLDGGQSGGQVGQGARPGQGATGGADLIEGTAATGGRGPRGTAGPSPSASSAARASAAACRWADGLGQPFLLRGQHGVLVGVVEAGPVDLRQLVAQQIDLAGPGPVVAAQARRARPPGPAARRGRR